MTSDRHEPPPAPDGPTEPFPTQIPSSGERARAVGRGLGTGAKATAKGMRGMARVTPYALEETSTPRAAG